PNSARSHLSVVGIQNLHGANITRHRDSLEVDRAVDGLIGFVAKNHLQGERAFLAVVVLVSRVKQSDFRADVPGACSFWRDCLSDGRPQAPYAYCRRLEFSLASLDVNPNGMK